MWKRLFKEDTNSFKCPRCGEIIDNQKNIKYVQCECGKICENPKFVSPEFVELSFSPLFDVQKVPESVFNIACKVKATIRQVEMLGNNEVLVHYYAKVCESHNETILFSNLEHLNYERKYARFNLNSAACKNHLVTCDYAYCCPIRLATYLWLVENLPNSLGDNYINEQRRLAKKDKYACEAKKHFNWDVNNHTSEHFPTKLLNFIEKLLDNNYITFSHDSVEEARMVFVPYVISKHLLEIPLETLMKMSQKEMKKKLTTDLLWNQSPISYIGDAKQHSLPHLAKYVDYLRRNNSYISFFKEQQKNERKMRKNAETTSE